MALTISEAVSGPHTVNTRIYVGVDQTTGWLAYRDTNLELNGWQEATFGLISGSITESLNDPITRSLKMTIVSDYWESVFDAIKAVSPYKTIVLVVREIGTRTITGADVGAPPTPLFRIPLGVFRITDVQLSNSATESWTIEVSGYSREVDIRNDRFESSVVGNGLSILNHVSGYVRAPFRAPASVTIINSVPSGHRFSTRTIGSGLAVTNERDRLKLIRDLQEDSGIWGRFDRRGQYVFSPAPTVSDTPAHVVAAGEGGVLIGFSKSYDRNSIYNAVIVNGENRSTGDTYTAVARDTVATSPTLYGGPFGKVPRFYYSPFIWSTADAQSTADSLLAKSLSRKSGIDFQSVPNPDIEAGDVVRVQFEDGGYEDHLITELTIDLGVTEALQAKTFADPETQAELQDM